MRTIKFRAWDNEAKIMRHAFFVASTTGKCHSVTPALQEESLELMQFTGLKDKQGKEIYEGDIVKTENEQVTAYPVEDEYKGVVTYAQCCFLIQQPHDAYTPTLNNITIKSIEIIGNIYETPELLESH